MSKTTHFKAHLQSNEQFVIQELKISGINMLDMVSPIILKTGEKLVITHGEQNTILIEVIKE